MNKPLNIDLSTKPKVTFSLDPVLQNYCRYVFKTPANKKQIVLNRKEDMGKLIFSHIQSGDFKIEQPLITDPVTFILPIPNENHVYWLMYRHIYIPRWVEEKYQDGIKYEFNWWVREKFRIGYEEEGWGQKLIVSTILRGLNVRNNKVNYDAIVKNDYRNRRKSEDKRFKKLCKAEQQGV